MAGVDTAVGLAWALVGTGVTLRLGAELYGHFIAEPRVKQEAANVEELAKQELATDSYNLAKDSTSGSSAVLADQLEKLRRDPGEFGEVIIQMRSDHRADPNLPAVSLVETDQPGVLGALMLAQGKVDVAGGGDKQLIFPMTGSTYDKLKQNADWMSTRHFEVILPASFKKN